MRKRFGSALRIGLSKTGATVVRTSGWLQTHSEVLAERAGSQEECASPESVINKLGVLLKDVDCSRMPARIVLSDSWVRRWMVVPPQNATSLADCHAAASARFQALSSGGRLGRPATVSGMRHPPATADRAAAGRERAPAGIAGSGATFRGCLE